VIVAYIVVVALALLPQITFSFLYWRWIPSWIRNPYGRLAQFGAWCHIVFLSIFEFFLVFGRHINPKFASYVFILSFLPLIFFGILQLDLLKKAVNSAREEQKERNNNDD
jgi:hypothetical protein